MKLFEWMIEHQEAFDALEEALSAAPVLGYPDFTREFILETDASLNDLGAILSEQDKDGKYLCNCLCKPIFTPIQKIPVQLQFSQTGTISAKMGCN